MKTNKILNIMIVDDHSLFRDGLKLLINSHKDFKVVGEASNGKEFVDNIGVIPADIVLLDISMPEMDGVEATKIALELRPDIKIITLSMYGEEEYYTKMMNAGAHGFVLKDSDINEVYAAIHNVNDGKNYFSQELLQSLLKKIKRTNDNNSAINDLSNREIEIISLICKGFSNAEIAEKLFISKRTVDKHRANILCKTNARNTASLVMFAIKNKLVEIDY